MNGLVTIKIGVATAYELLCKQRVHINHLLVACIGMRCKIYKNQTLSKYACANDLLQFGLYIIKVSHSM